MKLAATVLAFAMGFAMPARADIAHDLVVLPALKAMRADMETALADVLTRSVFRGLRSDAQWGPANRVWQSRFVQFRDAYLDFAAPVLARVEPELETELRLHVNSADLGSLLRLLRDGTYANAMTELALLGLDGFTMVRVAGVSRFPDLYSESEKLGVHVRFNGLAERQRDSRLDKASTDAAVKVAQRTEVHQLQSVLSAVVSGSLKQAIDDGAGAQAFLARWRNEVKED
jgi:hypothetical protein